MNFEDYIFPKADDRKTSSTSSTPKRNDFIIKKPKSKENEQNGHFER